MRLIGCFFNVQESLCSGADVVKKKKKQVMKIEWVLAKHLSVKGEKLSGRDSIRCGASKSKQVCRPGLEMWV